MNGSLVGRPWWIEETKIPAGLYPDYTSDEIEAFRQKKKLPDFANWDQIDAFVEFWESPQGRRKYESFAAMRRSTYQNTLEANNLC